MSMAVLLIWMSQLLAQVLEKVGRQQVGNKTRDKMMVSKLGASECHKKKKGGYP